MANGKRKKSKKKLFIFGGLGLLVIILVIVALTGGSKENIILVQTEKVAKRSITQTVTATGTVDPEFKVIITPEVTGEIISLPVKEGDVVKKGQLLIKIKGDQYMAQKDRLEANLKSAEASLRMSEAELTRIELGNLPLTMLAAVGWADVLLPALQASAKKETEPSFQISAIERNVLFYLALYMAFSAYQFGFQLSGAALPKLEYEAMDWISQNTPEGSRFLVLSGTNSVACDSVAEWFPALTGRHSLITVQGTEWTREEEFKPFIRDAVALQKCSQETLACVDQLLDPAAYDYGYFSKILRSENCEPLPVARSFLLFAEGVRGDERYEVVYETDAVLIYKKR